MVKCLNDVFKRLQLFATSVCPFVCLSLTVGLLKLSLLTQVSVFRLSTRLTKYTLYTVSLYVKLIPSRSR